MKLASVLLFGICVFQLVPMYADLFSWRLCFVPSGRSPRLTGAWRVSDPSLGRCPQVTAVPGPAALDLVTVLTAGDNPTDTGRGRPEGGGGADGIGVSKPQSAGGRPDRRVFPCTLGEYCAAAVTDCAFPLVLRIENSVPSTNRSNLAISQLSALQKEKVFKL